MRQVEVGYAQRQLVGRL